ncbi:arrestin domain-containing protein 2 [Drosophila subobscura]|uniref:arrestin domain-containing protein 2 n=1 Tax=Drosophila subobscura TaxID=7241 RepID=UPI00155ADB67|nr:arrestin domain-containing protein 2 [Drosophila subobscura]
MVICEIQFNNNAQGIYYAGQVISGQVVIQTDKVKQVKAVVLKIKGYAETHWADPEYDSADQSSGSSFNGHVDYLATKAYLHGSSSSVEVQIEPGTSTYRFACQIPLTCPSSFEGTYGRVRYIVNVMFLRPWKFDQNFNRCFTVLKVMDLNTESLMLRVPTQVESQRTYCCIPCTSKPLSLRLSLPQGGFVPGQTIPMGVLVSNDSHIQIEEITVRLAMVVIYYSRPPCADTNKDRFVVAEKTGEGVSKNSRKQFTFDLQVPATPPTCFNLCSIIQIGYQVEAEVKVKGCHSGQSVHMPVTIGSVPLTKQLQKQPRTWEGDPLPPEVDAKALILLQEEAVDAAACPPSPWAADPSITPPNFNEAKHIRPDRQRSSKSKKKSQKKAQTEEIVYTPLYAVFDLTSEMENAIERPKGYQTEGGFVNEDIDRSTWL